MPALDRPGVVFSISPALDNGPHVAAARVQYDGRVLPLLFWPGASAPTFHKCIAAVHARAEHL